MFFGTIPMGLATIIQRLFGVRPAAGSDGVIHRRSAGGGSAVSDVAGLQRVDSGHDVYRQGTQH